MESKKTSAFRQFIGSERVIGALLLIALVSLTLFFPAAFADYQQELGAILAAFVAQFIGLHTYVKVSGGKIVFRENPERPILEPLSKLWKSRKFMATLIGLVLELLVIYLHLPEAIRVQLMGTILLLITVYNGAIAAEDVKVNEVVAVPAPLPNPYPAVNVTVPIQQISNAPLLPDMKTPPQGAGALSPGVDVEPLMTPELIPLEKYSDEGLQRIADKLKSVLESRGLPSAPPTPVG